MREKKIRLMLADDHEVVREGLRVLLEQQPDICIVATVSGGRSAVEMAREKRPDVIVMDVRMPDLNGVDATCEIVGELPSVKVLCLSAHRDPRTVAAMLRAGASGYLVKDCAADDLVSAIRAVASGSTYLSPAVAGGIIREYVRVGEDPCEAVFSRTSRREREVLRLIAEGHNQKQIAGILGISGKTVTVHRLSLMRKLKCDSVVGLTRYAIRQGIVDA